MLGEVTPAVGGALPAAARAGPTFLEVRGAAVRFRQPRWAAAMRSTGHGVWGCKDASRCRARCHLLLASMASSTAELA